MIRGTTAQFKFKLPYNVWEVSMVKITFWQEDYKGPHYTRPLPIVKTLNQCAQTSSPNELVVKLNKEETLRFTDKRKASVQLQGKTLDRIAFASKPELITVYPAYDDSVLDDEILPTPPIDPAPGEDEIIILDGEPII